MDSSLLFIQGRATQIKAPNWKKEDIRKLGSTEDIRKELRGRTPAHTDSGDMDRTHLGEGECRGNEDRCCTGTEAEDRNAKSWVCLIVKDKLFSLG